MKFGDRVFITAKLARGHIERPQSDVWIKGWTRSPLKEPREGIYLGKRTLSTGRTVNDYEGSYYEPLEYTKAILVAVSNRENPVYVLPEDVEEIDEQPLFNQIRMWLTANIGHAAADPNKRVVYTEEIFRNLQKVWFGR